MLQVTTIADLRSRRGELFTQGRTVAFVPTMGALHEGHLALVERGREMADEVWASVFVNPAQFGPGEDFERYPRDLDADRQQLARRGVTVLFAPSLAEMYPEPSLTAIHVGGLSHGLCGTFRPGHFDGVALVVCKLLNIVRPEIAVFGAKDYQQAAVISRLVADLDMGVRIEVVPTVRESDGLARSSRNAYLSTEERRAAAVVPRALEAAATAFQEGSRTARELERVIAEAVSREPLVRTQYVAAVDPVSLRPLEDGAERVLLAVAVYVGATRLIDNVVVGA